jgi:hypothetical protein
MLQDTMLGSRGAGAAGNHGWSSGRRHVEDDLGRDGRRLWARALGRRPQAPLHAGSLESSGVRLLAVRIEADCGAGGKGGGGRRAGWRGGSEGALEGVVIRLAEVGQDETLAHGGEEAGIGNGVIDAGLLKVGGGLGAELMIGPQRRGRVTARTAVEDDAAGEVAEVLDQLGAKRVSGGGVGVGARGGDGISGGRQRCEASHAEERVGLRGSVGQVSGVHIEIAEHRHEAALLQGKHLLADRLKRLLQKGPAGRPAAGGPVFAGQGRHAGAADEQVGAAAASAASRGAGGVAVGAAAAGRGRAAHPQPQAVARRELDAAAGREPAAHERAQSRPLTAALQAAGRGCGAVEAQEAWDGCVEVAAHLP